MTTYAIALSAAIPRIVIPVGSNKKMTFVPFAKSVGYNSGNYTTIGTGPGQWTKCPANCTARVAASSR